MIFRQSAHEGGKAVRSTHWLPLPPRMSVHGKQLKMLMPT